jgi:hypothetical protein
MWVGFQLRHPLIISRDKEVCAPIHISYGEKSASAWEMGHRRYTRTRVIELLVLVGSPIYPPTNIVMLTELTGSVLLTDPFDPKIVHAVHASSRLWSSYSTVVQYKHSV